MGKEKGHEISDESLMEVSLLLLLHYEKDISKIPTEIWDNLLAYLPQDFKDLKTRKQVTERFLRWEHSNGTLAVWRSAMVRATKGEVSEDAVLAHAYLRGEYMGYANIADRIEKNILLDLYVQGLSQHWFPDDFLVGSNMLYDR